jgi:hypothetical protein
VGPAKVVLARHALPAMHATAGRPAQSDALADIQALRSRAERRNAPDNFMSEDRWKLSHAPVVVEHCEVGMAKAAILDRNFDLLDSKRPEFYSLLQQLLLRPGGTPRSITNGYSFFVFRP